MTTYAELTEEIRDSADVKVDEVSDSAMLNLVKRAVRMVRGTGALIDLGRDITGITLAANTWEYTVPANFKYIHHLAHEGVSGGTATYDEWVPRLHWSMFYDGANPKFLFDSWLFDLRTGKKIGVYGQGEPTVPTALTGTVDTEVEEAVQAALWTLVLGRLSQSGSSQGQGQGIDRANQRRESLVTWDAFTHADYRVLPNSVRVPGR